MLSRACALLVLLVCTTPVPAEIYKWVDTAGRVHYSDRPHPGGTETIDLPAAAPTDPELAERRRKRQRLLEAIAQERKEEREAQEQAKRQQAKRSRRCARAMDELRMVDRQGRVYELDDAGERRYWDAQTREQQRARITRYLDEKCN